jgi:hypothetical protein
MWLAVSESCAESLHVFLWKYPSYLLALLCYMKFGLNLSLDSLRITGKSLVFISRAVNIVIFSLCVLFWWSLFSQNDQFLCKFFLLGSLPSHYQDRMTVSTPSVVLCIGNEGFYFWRMTAFIIRIFSRHENKTYFKFEYIPKNTFITTMNILYGTIKTSKSFS